VSTEKVVAVELPHYHHHTHLQRCWWKILDLEAVNWKTVTKVDMAYLHPSCQQMHNISPCRYPNPFQFLVFDSETADEPVSDANLGLEAVNWKTVTKVDVAYLRPSCQQMRNISPCRCPNPFQFLVFDSETADEPVSDANLGLEAVNWKTVAKVGMAHLWPSCQQMHNISPRCCPNPLQFLVFDSETADVPVSDVKPHHVAF